MTQFTHTVRHADPDALHALRIDTVMVNVGLKCDQACAHCHLSCSPLRTERMTREVMDLVVAAIDDVRPNLVDVTGGAPELNPDLRYLLARLRDAGHAVRLRTNLTALLTPEAEGLVPALAEGGISVLASLPGATPEAVAGDRGPVLERALEALRLLNGAGYGSAPHLRLDIAINRRADEALEADGAIEDRFRRDLGDRLGIRFDGVIVITNVPVGRFRERLQREGGLGTYLSGLRDSFNADTLSHLACRTCLEIAWDGTLWDCDFNLGRGLPLADGLPRHISEFDAAVLSARPLRFAEHCYACTASAGSG